MTLVMLRHYVVIENPQDRVAISLSSACSLGWIGVDVFFVLSGFLITGILLKSQRDPSFFSRFYARRCFRILPLYYLFLLAFLVAIPFFAKCYVGGGTDPIWARLGETPSDGWRYWCFLSNIPIGLRGFRYPVLDISWSLAIEEQFYLVWPLAVRYLSLAALRRLCGAIFVFSLLSRACIFWCGLPSAAAYVWTPCRLDGFAAGALVAIGAGGSVCAVSRLRHYRLTAILGAAVFAATLFGNTVGGTTGAAFVKEAVLDSPLVMVVGVSALAICFSGVVGCMVSGDPILTRGMMRDAGVLATIGKYSYCIYLTHIPIGGAVEALVQYIGIQTCGSGFSAKTYPILAAVVLLSAGASYVVALISWRLWEGPWLAVRERLCPAAA